MKFWKAALVATGVMLPLGFGAAAQPVSGLYVGAGAGANWLVGAQGNVVGEDPANLVARALGAPSPAAIQNAAVAARQAALATQALATQATAQAAAAQAVAANPLLAQEVRAAAQQAAATAQVRATQATAQATVAQSVAQRAQTASDAVTATQGLDRTAKISFDVGFVGVVSVGWGFGNGLRAEVEGNYRQNDVDKVRFLGLSTESGGTARSYGVMANLIYDFDPSFFGLGPSVVQPYLGVGAGYVWTQYDKLRASAAGLAVTLNDTDGQFAFQGIAGVAVPLTRLGVRGLSLTAEYRFLGTLQPRVGAELRVGGADGPVILHRSFDSGNYNHSALLGIRYAFNQPTPLPPPLTQAPAPTAPSLPSRTYLVFFNWDRADLTDRARQVIAEAAQATSRVQVTRIEVAGHTDASGAPRYNQGLSVRRAQNVASELVRLGVARQAISIQGFGESRPLVQTADGVREPQNRRVEIVLR